MLVIRFIRTGKRNQPFFRIVVTDKKNPPRGGKFLEILGFFNPLTKAKELKKERIKYWLSVGAQPSESVHNLLVSEGVIKGEKIDVFKKPKKKEEAGEEKQEEEKEAQAPEGAEEEGKKEEKEEVKEKEPEKEVSGQQTEEKKEEKEEKGEVQEKEEKSEEEKKEKTE